MAPSFPKLRTLLPACLLIGAGCAGRSLADPAMDAAIAREALDIVSRQIGEFANPPRIVPTRKMPDGPLLGNGDLGVVLGGVIERRRYFGLGEAGGANVNIRDIAVTNCPERHRFWIAKNDFWKSKSVYPNAHPAPIAFIDLNIPALVNGSYSAQQLLASGEVLQTLRTTQRVEDPPPFTRPGTEIQIRSWTAATTNLLVIELSVSGDNRDRDPFQPTSMVGVDVSLAPITGNESETASGNLPDGSWAVRRFSGETNTLALERTTSAWKSEAAVAMRLFHHRDPGLPWSRGDGWSADRFVLAPGRPITIVASVVTREESPHPLDEARRRVLNLEEPDLVRLRAEHLQWWRRFWSASFVQIGDPLIERFYYGSQYLMASCSRNPRFPPSLFGNWITMDGPAWQADYHLNYNHEAPWWGVFSSNHPELSEPYDAPILEFMERARVNAHEYLKARGIYYDVGVGPKGLETSLMPAGHSIPGEGNRMFLGQKSNAAFAAANMLLRYRHTLDPDYARRVYPFLLATADFWEDYLHPENGRLVITRDASGEVGDGGSDRNNCLSLGLVRMLFQGIVEMSTDLGVDAPRRSRWREILEKISPFPTMEVHGIRRIRGAESGPAADRIGPGRNNTRIEFMGMVWPSCVLGLETDAGLLKVLREDVKGWADSEWIGHFNGFSMTFPGAVRVGHDPTDILARLRRQLAVAGFPNLMVFTGGGGIENCAGVPSTINEMLVQSHGGVIRLFPVWPREVDARFGRLRVPGAFLLTASRVRGEIGTVTIESEKGRECVLANPWPGRPVACARPGAPIQTLSGERIRLKTTAGERMDLLPGK